MRFDHPRFTLSRNNTRTSVIVDVGAGVVFWRNSIARAKSSRMVRYRPMTRMTKLFGIIGGLGLGISLVGAGFGPIFAVTV